MTPRHRAVRRRHRPRGTSSVLGRSSASTFRNSVPASDRRSRTTTRPSSRMTESIMSLQQFLRKLALGRRWVGDHEVSDSAANRHAFCDVGGADLGHEDGLAQSSSPSLCLTASAYSKPVRLVQQRSSDDGGGVGATRLQRRRQHDVRGPAAAAANPARAHRHCRCPVRAHRAGATVAPGEQPTTAATRAAQRPGGQSPRPARWCGRRSRRQARFTAHQPCLPHPTAPEANWSWAHQVSTCRRHRR